MANVSGTTTVGPGKDYSTFEALRAALAPFVLVGDWDVVLYAHTCPVLGPNMHLTFNGYTCTIRGATAHNGNPNSGERVDMAGYLDFGFERGFPAGTGQKTGHFVFRNVYIRNTTLSFDDSGLGLSPGQDCRVNITIDRFMHDANGMCSQMLNITEVAYPTVASAPPETHATRSQVVIKNCKGWSHRNGTIANVGAINLGIGGYQSDVSAYVENNVLYTTSARVLGYGMRIRSDSDVPGGSIDKVVHELRNNAVFGYGAGLDHAYGIGDEVGGNASDDSSANEGLQNLVAADVFYSLDDTSADFLGLGEGGIASFDFSGSPRVGKKPLTSRFVPSEDVEQTDDVGPLAYAGVTPLYTPEDIAGHTRGAYGFAPSIGCHEPTIREWYSEQIG